MSWQRRGALTAPTVTHDGAKRVGELLRSIDDYEGSGITRLALQIAPHVFVRPGVRHADWSEIDLDTGLWAIPAGKMKMPNAHHVPLSRDILISIAHLCSFVDQGPYTGNHQPG